MTELFDSCLSHTRRSIKADLRVGVSSPFGHEGGFAEEDSSADPLETTVEPHELGMGFNYSSHGIRSPFDPVNFVLKLGGSFSGSQYVGILIWSPGSNLYRR